VIGRTDLLRSRQAPPTRTPPLSPRRRRPNGGLKGKEPASTGEDVGSCGPQHSWTCPPSPGQVFGVSGPTNGRLVQPYVQHTDRAVTGRWRDSRLSEGRPGARRRTRVVESNCSPRGPSTEVRRIVIHRDEDPFSQYSDVLDPASLVRAPASVDMRRTPASPRLGSGGFQCGEPGGIAGPVARPGNRSEQWYRVALGQPVLRPGAAGTLIMKP
jgi:hypothetical protein